MQSGDRFWYTYQTRDGRRFYMVDPLKKAKAPLFDHAKMAAALTSITRQPYDAQHLPFSNIKFKNDAVFEFDVSGPARRRHRHDEEEDHDDAAGGRRRRRRRGRRRRSRSSRGQRGAGPGAAARTPPRNRTLRFEYDMASRKVTLNEDYVAPAAAAALGHDRRPTSRPSSSRATTTST